MTELSILILAGGRGSRLTSMLAGQPKALLRLPGKIPLLAAMIRQSEAAGRKPRVVVDSMNARAVIAGMHAIGVSAFDVSVDFGTGTADAITTGLRDVRSDWVMVCNSDTFVPADLAELARVAVRSHPVVQVVAPFSVQNQGLIGVTRDASQASVQFWGESASQRPPVGLEAMSSTGAYLIRRDFWLAEVAGDRSIENDTMPRLVSMGVVGACVVPSNLPVYDYGTPERLRQLVGEGRLLQRLVAAASLTEYLSVDEARLVAIS